jgi:NAD-dependent deacetylase
VKSKKHIVVLSGAGISAESGLKTFRDSDGLWNGYDVYEVASPQGWQKDPQLVLDFYNARRKDVAAALPNAAHQGLAELQNDFEVTIITQNIDDLHERAGSANVLHLHGNIFKMRSIANEHIFFEKRRTLKPIAHNLKSPLHAGSDLSEIKSVCRNCSSDCNPPEKIFG